MNPQEAHIVGLLQGAALVSCIWWWVGDWPL